MLFNLRKMFHYKFKGTNKSLVMISFNVKKINIKEDICHLTL